jgi:Ala-tRNA(Pro) deacylase
VVATDAAAAAPRDRDADMTAIPPQDPSSRRPAAAAVHTLLDDARLAHRMVEHPPTFRAGDEAEAVGLPAGRTAKTVVTVERGTIRLAVIPASRRLDLQRMREAVGAGRHLRLATEAELAAAFPDFEVGAVPPLGRLIGLDEVVDPLVIEHDEILAAAGDHAHGMLVDPARLADVTGARIADVCVRPGDDERRHRFRDAPLL